VVRDLLRLTAVRVAIGSHVLIALILCFVPLFDVLGFERAFVTTIFAAPFAGGIAISLAKTAETDERLTIERIGSAGMALILLLLSPAIALGLVVELVKQPCSPGQGLGFTLLTGGTAAMFGGAIGLLAVATTRWHRHPRLVTALVLLGSLGVSLARLYTDPQIFAFSMPFGYWPGSIYDEEISISAALGAHRALTALVAIAIFSSLRAVWDPRYGRREAGLHRPSLVWASLFWASAITLYAHRHDVGFDLDRRSVEEELSRRVVLDEVEIWIDPSVSEEELDRLVEDHLLRYQQLTAFFGTHPKRRIKSYVYRDVEQKRTLMGASSTQISRPWSGEIHIDGFDTPHRVLKHELAHVFAAELATGPFRVPALGGVLINLAIVEGTAVAADWPFRQMTVHQWAQAMRLIELAPDLEVALYPTGFWTQASSRAYTAAGSFLRYLIEGYGIEPFAKLYATNDFEGAYGKPLVDLIKEWESFLDRILIRDEDRTLAEHRFRQGSIFQRTCPHTTARLAEDGLRLLAGGDLPGAIPKLERVIEYDPGRTDVLLSIAKALGERDRVDEGRTYAERAIATPSATVRAKASAEETLADLDWRAGRKEDAAKIYRGILEKHLSDESDRLQTVKLEATERPDEIASELMRYLTTDLPVARAVVLLSELARDHPSDPLIQYLYAKRLESVGSPEEGVRVMESAIRLGISSEVLAREADLALARMLLRSGRFADAEQRFRDIAARAVRPVIALEALDGAERAVLAAQRHRPKE
jgi:tetratricopeptide (TPR) repeat protein